MNSISAVNSQSISAPQMLTESLYNGFISYLDASPKTVATYSRALAQFFKWMRAGSITMPTYADVKAYRDALLKTRKPATVTAYIFAVRKFFEWTSESGIYPNVAGKIKGAKLDREHKKDYLTASQVKTVLAGINRESDQGLRDYAILSLMISCGLRDIEVSRANVEDLRTAGENVVLYIQGKGHNERNDYVIVPNAVERAIREYLKTRNAVNGSAPLFASMSNNSKGQRMTTRSISAIAKKAMQTAGYNSDRLTAHSLRHTAVTLALLANGGNIQEAQQFARHSNISTTMIYAHNLERAKNACSRLVADSIF